MRKEQSDEAEMINYEPDGPRPNQESSKKRGTAPLRPPSPPLTRSKAAASGALSSGMACPSLLSASSKFSFALSSSPLHPGPNPDSTHCTNLEISPLNSKLDPPPLVEPPSNPSTHEIPIPGIAPEPHRYHLYSHTRASMSDAISLCISPFSSALKPTRGRPSSLSKEKQKAGLEVVFGKQLSLDRVLRAQSPPPVFPR